MLAYDELMAQNRALETERRKFEALLRAAEDRANSEREMRVRLEEEKAFALRQLEELKKSYAILQQEHELQRRRIFEATAERVDPSQLELEFEKTKTALDEMQKKLVEAAAAAGIEVPPPPPPAPKKRKSTGRRKLDASMLPVERIEILAQSSG